MFIVSGIPVDDAKNRAFAQRMGAAGIPWPPPYKNSVLARCQDCDGKVYVGPLLQARREAMTKAGEPFRLLCLLCAALESRLGGVAMLKLSDKEPGA
jgi:hypothetical protein